MRAAIVPKMSPRDGRGPVGISPAALTFRWVLHGTYHGRTTALRGITISRLGEDGRTLEDRGHSDSIALLGELGVIRTLILGLEILTHRVKLPKGVLRAYSI